MRTAADKAYIRDLEAAVKLLAKKGATTKRKTKRRAPRKRTGLETRSRKGARIIRRTVPLPRGAAGPAAAIPGSSVKWRMGSTKMHKRSMKNLMTLRKTRIENGLPVKAIENELAKRRQSKGHHAPGRRTVKVRGGATPYQQFTGHYRRGKYFGPDYKNPHKEGTKASASYAARQARATAALARKLKTSGKARRGHLYDDGGRVCGVGMERSVTKTANGRTRSRCVYTEGNYDTVDVNLPNGRSFKARRPKAKHAHLTHPAYVRKMHGQRMPGKVVLQNLKNRKDPHGRKILTEAGRRAMITDVYGPQAFKPGSGFGTPKYMTTMVAYKDAKSKERANKRQASYRDRKKIMEEIGAEYYR